MQKSIGSQIVIPPQSPSAIPIVAPSEGNNSENGSSKPAKPVSKGNTKRLCRNVIIHGFCKFEGKGCEFNHETNKPTTSVTEYSGNTRPQTPSRSNSGVMSFVTPESVNAPVFVPKSATLPPTDKEAADNVPATTQAKPSGESSYSGSETNEALEFTQAQSSESNPLSALTSSFSHFRVSSEPVPMTPTSPMEEMRSPTSMMANMNMMSSGHMDPYYYMGTPVFTRMPLQYHLYTSTLPHVSNLLPHQRTIQSFFIPDNLREELTRQNEASLTSAPARELGLPEEVHVYHSLYPLDEQPNQPSKFYGHMSYIYKAVCSVDGLQYVLVRIEGFRLVNEAALSTVENWRLVQHVNIVSVREAFTTRAFGDSSLVFVFDYHPCAKTLFNTYFTLQGQQTLQSQLQANNSKGLAVPETTLWSYIIQITSALKTIHAAGLAARTIEPTRILVTGKHRLRLNCLSIPDVLQYDGNHNVARHQQEDLLAFGKLVVSLACNSVQSFHNLPQAFEMISRCYSADLKNLVLYLLSKPMPGKSVDEVLKIIGPHFLHEIDSAHAYNDVLESELSRELENGRVVRLLSKMGFINERPEFDMDPSWSETGDRYIIKLFRDYVFHQVDENGVPVVDMVHVLSCLNKLDAGIDEKIMLMSRDEQSCLIVSYKEVKNCIISAFKDLSSGRK